MGGGLLDRVRPEGSKGGGAGDSGVPGRRVCSRVFRTWQHGGQCGWRGAGVRSRVGDRLSGTQGQALEDLLGPAWK